MDAHEHRVVELARALATHTPGAPLSIQKRAVSHRVPKPRDARYREERIDLSEFDRILAIDERAKLKFKLVRAKRHVHLVYETHASFREYAAAIQRHASEGARRFPGSRERAE